MELLKLKIRIPSPKLLLVYPEDDVSLIPTGVNFIRIDHSQKDEIIRLVTYEVLLRSALKTGMPFDFKKILKENGYDDLTDFPFVYTTYVKEYTDGEKAAPFEEGIIKVDSKDFLKDTKTINLEKLMDLNLLPDFFKTIEETIAFDAVNSMSWEPNKYNIVTDSLGGYTFKDTKKNLLVVDISGSIYKGISKALILLSKSLSQRFNADLLITGTISTLYEKDKIHKLDSKTIYDVNGMENDQKYFKKIVSNHRDYDNIIVFGDNHSPCYGWNGESNISRSKGQEINQFTCNKVISLHTTSNKTLAGYGDWFTPKHGVTHIKDWTVFFK